VIVSASSERGAAPEVVSFSEVAVGDPLPELSLGPITEVDVVRWCVAVENYHRIHYDLPFATDHEGLEAVIVNGPFKLAMLTRLLTDWLPEGGRLRSIRCRHTAPTYVGETLHAGGVITSKTVDDAVGLLGVDLHLTSDNRGDVCPASAFVSVPIPSKEHHDRD
jgi:acyl dehydratase